jgi:hypothetical protein
MARLGSGHGGDLGRVFRERKRGRERRGKKGEREGRQW